MPLSDREARKQIVEIGRLMYQKGWVAANDGNISARIAPDRIIATPTGISKGMMSEDDLIVCDLEGRKVEGSRAPTTEMPMHLLIYRMRPDVEGIVHAHAPVATGFAVAGKPLDIALLPEVVIYLGSIPLAGYGLPGTDELSHAIEPYVRGHDALLMANHGVVTYGADLRRAFFNMETVEHVARIALVAEMLGGAKALPGAEVQRLLEARSRYGVNARAEGDHANRPRSADDVAGSEPRSVSRHELAALIDEYLKVRG